MVIIDQLRISDDGKRMYINVHVNQASYFDDVYLKDITIMTSDKVSETAPEGVIIDPSTSLPTDCIYHKIFDGNQKNADLIIDKGVLDDAFNHMSSDGATATLPYSKSSFSGELLFVYVRVKGTVDSCVPCGLDNETTLGVTIDYNVFYRRVMDYVKTLAADCIIPKEFTDFILLWNAFKSAIITGHYIPAINYYNMLFGKDEEGNDYGPYGISSSKITIKRCNCNG